MSFVPPGESLFATPPCIPQPGIPLLAVPVPAGPPVPAVDHVACRLGLERHLYDDPEQAFLVRASGQSMSDMGLRDGDLLVVDRAGRVVDRSVVVAVVDGRFMVKQLCRTPEGVLLRSRGGRQGDILVGAEQELVVWGVVRWAIHRV